MKPKIGDEVKFFFKNSLQVEGRVTSWGKKIVLSSHDNNHFMVIKDQSEILMYKISRIKKTEQSLKESENFIEEIKEIENNLDEAITTNNDIDYKLHNLAELHKIKLEEEKKDIAKKIKQHQIKEFKKVEYGLPGFFTKQESE